MLSTTEPLFLGLDLSTQRLKAIILNKDSNVIHQIAVHFDRDLPHHGTTNGATQGPEKGEVTSPVQMWLEAIDLLFERLHDAGLNLGAIVAVSGAAQVCTLEFFFAFFLTCFCSNMVQSTGRFLQTHSSHPWILTSDSASNYFQKHFRIRRHRSGKIHPRQKIVNT